MTKCDLDSSFLPPRQLRKLAQPVIEKEIYIIFIQMTLQTWKREREREREGESQSKRERERKINILSVWDDSSQPIRAE